MVDLVLDTDSVYQVRGRWTTRAESKVSVDGRTGLRALLGNKTLKLPAAELAAQVFLQP
ncbi:hypothetical protein MTX26_06135 [Bradyrhizobium sp. ISRA443]|uniref:hypothetical protein n=1 Tax=unclassified Bradyrhizobium TaxID=2631580 RepID=UPI002478B73B|nr:MULTISPECIES: hypothetical protein [unclassified Bradyrhizobium]WGR95414.1 hypothetical protein MTX20_16330 [Bradyrhizobium sp. ISRA435]WGS00423.1 hypothetical protein MTX23_06135 [Bradyrhizobium sp. ISRA436]WGS07313.1 hypothetical protein MTX18_06135 [Bradyrhizobium sp. ISRA437]WGS14197.1 hypothetical protein MTX26_06135 [Bradyrhizobium sp. ISRA443]